MKSFVLSAFLSNFAAQNQIRNHYGYYWIDYYWMSGRLLRRQVDESSAQAS